MDPYLHAHREEEPHQSPVAVSKRPTEPLISIIGASLGTTPRSVSAAVAAAPRTASAAHGGSAAARPLATAQPLHYQAAAPIANAAATILGTTTKTSTSNARPPLQLPSRQQGQSTQSAASSVLHSIDPKSVDSKSLEVKSHGGPKRSPRRSPRRQSPAVSIAESAVTPNTGRAGQDAHRPPPHEDARRGGSGSVSAAVAAALGPHLTSKSAPSGITTINDASSKRGPHATARTPSDLPTTISDSIIPERSETKPHAALERGGVHHGGGVQHRRGVQHNGGGGGLGGGAQHGGHLPPRGVDAGLLGSSRTGIAAATPTGSATPGLLDNIGAPSLRVSNASAQPNRAPYVANFSRLLADSNAAGESGATRALHHQSNQGDKKGSTGGGIQGRDESSVRREIPTHPSVSDVPPQHRDQLLQFGQHGDIGHLGAGLVSSAHREASVNGNVGFLESSAAARGQVPPRKTTHTPSMVDTTLKLAADQGIVGEEDQVSAFDRLKTLRIHAARDKEVLLGRIEELSTALMQSQHRASLSDEEVKSYHEHFGSLDDFAARQVVQQEELLAAKKKLRAAIERANEAEAEADDLRRGIAAERAHIARHNYNIQTNQVLPAQIHQAPVNASRGPSAASGLISTSGQGGARDPSPTSAQQSQSASQLPLDGQTGGGGSGVGVVATAPVFGGAPEQFAASSTVPLIVVDPHAKLAHLESRLATALAESSLLQDEAASVCRTFAAKRAHIAASRKQKRLRDATEKLRGIVKKAAEMEANSTSLNNNGNGDNVDGDSGGVRPETLPYRMTKEAIAAEIAQEDRRRDDEDAFIDHETERALWQERGQLAEIDRLLSQKTTLVEQLDAAVDAARAELQHRQDDPQQSFPHTATMPQIAALLDAAPAASRGVSNHPLITPGTQAGVTDAGSRGVSAAAGAPVAAASGLPSHSQSPVLGVDPSVSGGGVGGDVVGGPAPIVDPSNQGSVHAASQQPSHVPSQSQSVQPNDLSRHGSLGGGSHAGGGPSAAGSVVGGASADGGGGLGQNNGTGLVASAAQSTTSQPAVPIAITRAELEHKMVHALASKEWMKLVNVGTYEVSYKNNTTGKIVPDLAREMAEELRRENAARHRAQLAADGDAVATAAAAVSSPSVPHAGNSSLAHGDGRSFSTALVPSPQQRRDGSTGSGSNALIASNNNLGPAGGGGRGVEGGLSNAALIDSNNEIAAAAAELRAQRDQSLAAVRLAEAATHTALSQVRSLAEKNKALKDENETVRKLLLRVAKAGLIGAPTRASTQEAAAAAAATEAATKANAAAAAASARGLSSSDPPPPGGDDDGPPPPSSDPSGEGAASGAAEKDGEGKPPVDPEMERLKSEVTVPLRMPGLPRLAPPELPATLDRERLAERAGRLEEDNDALRHRVVELSVEAAKKEDRLQALEETIRKLMPE